MVRQIASDFVVDTTGHCFICLIQLPPQLIPIRLESESPVSSLTHSLQHLSRYLKIKMNKVFHENDSIPKQLLEKVERSSLKVSLCDECVKWNAKLSELIQQLEKIEVEAASYLELLQRKGLEADENGRCSVFHKLDDSNSMDGLTGKFKLEVAEAIRGETIQKCSLKLSSAVRPKIKIKKMTPKELLSRIRTRSNVASVKRTTQENHLGQITEHLARSNSINLDLKLEYQNEASNDHFEDFDHLGEQIEGFEQPHFSDKMETTRNSGTCITAPKHTSELEYQQYGSKAVSSSDYKKYMRKLDTGKFSCGLCSKELASQGAFYNHYQSKHRKFGFQCSICSQVFSLKCNLKRHQQTVHFKH